MKNYQKRGNLLQKNCQEINTKSIFMNFEILRLNHRFPIYRKLLIYLIGLITTDVTL